MQCYHCGTEVFGTTHTQKSYRVDFYLLHTGHTEWEFLVNPNQDTRPLRYRKLIEAMDVLTCVRCYARPEIRRLLDDDFYGRCEILGRKVEVKPQDHHIEGSRSWRYRKSIG